jgi:multidrug efflux pump
MHPEHHTDPTTGTPVPSGTTPSKATAPSTDTAPPTAADTIGSNRWYLATAPIIRALIHLCVPMAAALVVSAVYNLINAGVVGSD